MKRVSFVTVVFLGAIAYLGAYKSELLIEWKNKAQEMFNSILKR